jgi:cystathionine beta-lyase
LSKTFNLAGLQLSNIIIPNKKLRDRFRNTIESLFIPEEFGYLPNTLSLVAYTAAYRDCDDWLTSLIQYLKENLEFLEEFLKDNIPQINVIKPEGTFLVWLDFSTLGIANEGLEDFLLENAKVALDDGVKFGKGGEGFQRINIACPRSTLGEALTRIHKALKELKQD